MNNQKDIQRQRFVNDKTSVGHDMFGITLTKRCERLATAVYLVTSFLSDIEPLKFRLRSLSVDIVRDVSSLSRRASSATEINVLDDVRGSISETLSLFELAFISGLVSEMNFTLLKREYVSLRDMIEVRKVSRESRTDNTLGTNFFNREDLPALPHPSLAENINVSEKGASHKQIQSSIQHSQMTDRISKSQMHPGFIPRDISQGKKLVEMSDRNKGHVESRFPDSQRNEDKELPKVIPNTVIKTSPRATTDVAKESRRARILKLIKDNKEVAIRDIVAHFPDLSEKTIQRELVAMSDSGVLKKFGERRWSRYALG